MKHIVFICCLLAVVWSDTQITIPSGVSQAGVRKLGLNIGGWNPGAHMTKSFISNGGFEGAVKSTVMLADASSTTTTYVQSIWTASSSTAQGVGYWDGATYLFLTGANQGLNGTITHQSISNNLFTYTLNPPATYTIAANDVLIISKKFQPSFGFAAQGRTGSVGALSYNLTSSNGYTINYDGGYRDADYTVGKTIIIQGNFAVGFWAKGIVGSTVTFFFGRELWNNGTTFFQKTYTINSTSWIYFKDNFYVRPYVDYPFPSPTTPCTNWPSCQRPMVSITLSTSSTTGILIDEMSLAGTDDTNPTIFTDFVVQKIKEYNPGSLRFWGNQLGASLEEQTSVEFKRGTHGYKPSDGSLSSYEFSLHEFLTLCQYVGTEPWYVMPPSFSKYELTSIVEYLAGPSTSQWGAVRASQGQTLPWTSVFKNIFIEFGNELWGAATPNDPFGGASMTFNQLGSAGNYSFSVMRKSQYFNSNIKLVLGGMAGYSGANQAIESQSNQHDYMCLAPYFGDLSNSWSTPEQKYQPLYAFPVQQNMTGVFKDTQGYINSYKHKTKLAIYEINFSFTSANGAPMDVRNAWMTGVAGGLNLPWSMLRYLQDYGCQPMHAFSMLGYSFLYSGALYPFPCSEPSTCAFAKVWGLLRDLDRVKTKRPTWLAVEIVNKAALTNLHIPMQTGDNPSWSQTAFNAISQTFSVNYINSFAFSDGAGARSVVMFNFHLSQALPVRVFVPATPQSSAVIYTLNSANLEDNNENGQVVSIANITVSNFVNGYSVTLPAHSLTVITWRDQ